MTSLALSGTTLYRRRAPSTTRAPWPPATWPAGTPAPRPGARWVPACWPASKAASSRWPSTAPAPHRRRRLHQGRLGLWQVPCRRRGLGVVRPGLRQVRRHHRHGPPGGAGGGRCSRCSSPGQSSTSAATSTTSSPVPWLPRAALASFNLEHPGRDGASSWRRRPATVNSLAAGLGLGNLRRRPVRHRRPAGQRVCAPTTSACSPAARWTPPGPGRDQRGERPGIRHRAGARTGRGVPGRLVRPDRVRADQRHLAVERHDVAVPRVRPRRRQFNDRADGLRHRRQQQPGLHRR